MYWQIALLTAQMILGEVTRQRPKRISFKEFVESNEPSQVRPLVYAGGTIELTPERAWYGDFTQRAVERDSHWSDYIWLGAFAFLLDAITVSYRNYIGEMFPLCFGPDTHVERITINDRIVYQATVGSDNAGGGFLIDDPQAWGGDQPPGGGGEYAFCHVTRGNYTDATDAYLESQLTTAPNKTPSLRGISALVKLGPSGDVPESGYFAAGALENAPKFKTWKVTVRRQPDNLATGFHKVGRHMNPMEVIYEWSQSLEYGARTPLDEINLSNWQSLAQDLAEEGSGWSGRIESATSPRAVIEDIMAQFDMVDDNSPSLGLGFRLIRRDYSFGSLRVLNRDNITRVERFAPGTYEDTKNKVVVEYPDQGNNFEPRPALYIDPANQQITGRIVPETKSFLGVADAEQANVIATRDGRAISLPRAPLECYVFPSFGRLTYRGEVVLFEWESPSFSIVMRVLAITPNGPEESDYRLVLIEDQFATGLRTFGEPVGTQHADPGAGLDTAPPSATWDIVEIPPDGLQLNLQLTSTNQFQPTIEGAISFGVYAPGGQYARLYVTEPGGVQTLSPARLVPDADNDARFLWPAEAVGEYQFCVETYSLKDVTNGVKVCATIDVAQMGSPSQSPSASISPSPSASPSPSSSQSPSTSPSLSPSASISASVSGSLSASVSPSASISPSASQSPSSSASPSAPEGPPSANLETWLKADEIVGLSNNDPVATWEDSSASNNDATQGTGGSQPIYKTNQINGLPAVDFASSKFMSWTTITSNDITVYAVFKGGLGGGTRHLFGHSSATNALRAAMDPFLLTGVGTSTEEMPMSDFCQINVAWNDTSGLVTTRVDEVDFISSGSGGSRNVTQLGAQASANFLNGLVAEVLIYSVAHDPTTIATVEEYLRVKYALPDPAVAVTDLTTVPGVKLWLKADAGVYNDAGSTLATDTQTVQQWNDQSGLGNNATQATSGNRPVYRTNILNSKPVIRLDGTDDWMQVGSMQMGSVMVVTVYGASGNFPNFKTPFNDRTASDGRVIVFDNGTTTLRSTARANGHFWRNGAMTNSAAPIDSWQVMFAKFNSFITDAADIGRDDQNNARAWNGDIAEIFVSDRCLSPAWRKKIQNYAGTKYNITIS